MSENETILMAEALLAVEIPQALKFFKSRKGRRRYSATEERLLISRTITLNGEHDNYMTVKCWRIPASERHVYLDHTGQLLAHTPEGELRRATFDELGESVMRQVALGLRHLRLMRMSTS